MTEPTPTSVSRAQRIIAVMVAAMVAVSVIAFIVILGAAYLGGSGEFDRGVWPVLALVPLIALPLAVIGWIALLVVSLRRRAIETAARAASERRPTKGAPPRTKSGSGPQTSKGSAPGSRKNLPGSTGPGSSSRNRPRPS